MLPSLEGSIQYRIPMGITNNHNIPLPLAVWLVDDSYDYITEENYISATALMKPLRQIVLPDRVPKDQLQDPDVVDFVARSMGHSLHDSIEKAWVKNYVKNLRKLGCPQSLIERVQINPEPEELLPNSVPIYIEQRGIKTINVDGIDYRVGGKFDMVLEGIVHDNKSTSAFVWVNGSRDDEHSIQGSIYRWIHPDKITEDFIRICYIFTDWKKGDAARNPKYPQQRCAQKDIKLMSIEDTEDWIRNKIRQVVKYKDAPEKTIPECSREELWMSEPTYKYYADANKTSGRSTKNFTDPIEARTFLSTKMGQGILLTVEGEAKRCGYCSAFPVCTQKNELNHGVTE